MTVRSTGGVFSWATPLLDETGEPPLLPQHHLRHGWVDSLGVLQRIDARRVAFVHVAEDGPATVSVTAVVQQLLAALELQPIAGEPNNLTLTASLRQRFLQRLHRQTDGVNGAKARLLAHWFTNPDLTLVDEAVHWAADLTDWGSLQRIWMNYLQEDGFLRHPHAAPPYRRLPVTARKRFPLLSLAAAYAHASVCTDSEREERTTRAALRDIFTLHSTWKDTDELDEAILSAAVWLAVHRIVPEHGPDDDLAEAWQVHDKVVAKVHTAMLDGRRPDRVVWGVFQAIAAQIAVLRLDFDRAASAAQIAIAMDGFGLSGAIAAGAKTMTRAIASLDPLPASHREAPATLRRIGRGTQSGSVAQQSLTAGFAAAHRLDQENATQLLAATTPHVRGASMWTVHTWLAAVVSMLWGDSEDALAVLDSSVSFHSSLSSEHLQPLGRMSLARARAGLLIQLGVTEPVHHTADTIPHPWHWVPLARAFLEDDNLSNATRVAESGLYDPATPIMDRHALSAVKAASLAMSEPGTDHALRQVANVAQRCTQAQTALPIALLPEEAREAFLGAAQTLEEHGDLTITGTAVEWCRGVLPRRRTVRPPRIHLTPREKVLLPLLATEMSVPRIAEELHVSVNTVRKQVATLRAKYGASTREALISRAQSAGHVPPAASH